MFSPELSPHWPADKSVDSHVAAEPKRDEQPPSPSQQEALQELVDRVNAARSIL